jgi:hypothetical protein
MPLDFPNSPATGQQFPATPAIGVGLWVWDGAEWTSPPLVPKTVSVNATGSAIYQGSAVTSQNYTGLTIVSGSNLALVVSVNWDSSVIPTGLAMTWDSGGTNQAMTRIIASNQGELWGLVNPTVGNKTLALSWTTAVRLFVVGMSFSGVDQTGGATSFPHSTSSATATLSVTSAAGNIVMGGGATGGAIGTPTGTVIYTNNVSGSVINAYSNYMTGASTVVFGSTGATGIYATVATDILAG